LSYGRMLTNKFYLIFMGLSIYGAIVNNFF